MLHYAEKQVEINKTLRTRIYNRYQITRLKRKDKDLEKFITPQYYQ
jgi:hypothetical protein